MKLVGGKNGHPPWLLDSQVIIGRLMSGFRTQLDRVCQREALPNFVGAGVFGGGTLNIPLANYYEHGTFLTLNHAHTAMFGAFGLLAIGLIYMVLRYLNGAHAWRDRLGVWAFWLYNIGLVMWIVLNFYPIGWPQLEAVYTHGYAYARSLKFYDTTVFWQWMRMPGDIVFAVGALLMAWDFVQKLWTRRHSAFLSQALRHQQG